MIGTSQTVFLSRLCAVFNQVLREGFRSMSAPVVTPSGRHSQTAGQSEYEEDQAEQPAGAISPIGAMRPGGQYPQSRRTSTTIRKVLSSFLLSLRYRRSNCPLIFRVVQLPWLAAMATFTDTPLSAMARVHGITCKRRPCHLRNNRKRDR